MARLISIAAMLLVGLGCGGGSGGGDGGSDSTVPIDTGPGVDAGPVGDSGPGDDAGACMPVTCELACEHGFQRGPDGCEICSCAPAPDESCGADADCVIARDVTGCCACDEGHSAARVEAEPCLVKRRETPPAGCLPDCTGVTCGPCPPVIVRAVCTAGTCTGSEECEAGEVIFGLDCAPVCASHADCTMAADYGVCCGGCVPAPVAYVDADPCYAERQSESSCAPPAGACDGLGCASPPTDCAMFGGAAVCMSDGTCQNAGPDGGCPAGTSDTGGVCTPD